MGYDPEWCTGPIADFVMEPTTTMQRQPRFSYWYHRNLYHLSDRNWHFAEPPMESDQRARLSIPCAGCLTLSSSAWNSPVRALTSGLGTPGGIPLAIQLTGANRNDSQQALALVDAIPPLQGERGRPPPRPRGMHERTYQRLFSEALQSEEVYWGSFAGWMSTIQSGTR